MTFQVQHDEDNGLFFIELEGTKAFLKYYAFESKKVLDYQHTFTPPELRRQQLASAIAKAALDYAKDNGYKIIPTCSFIRKYVQDHAEYQDLVVSKDDL